MGGDSWDDRRRALEDSYFEKQNAEALERLKSRKSEKPRLSPVTGKPMEELTLMGVAVDRCPDSGGIWLDAGELELILNNAKQTDQGDWMKGFFGLLRKR